MKKTASYFGALAIAILTSAVLLAHDMTFKGTVAAVKTDKLEVKVIDEKTQKESSMTFEVTSKTKVFRGEQEVKFADAHVQKDERIAVTVNHDVSATKATVLRLAAH